MQSFHKPRFSNPLPLARRPPLLATAGAGWCLAARAGMLRGDLAPRLMGRRALAAAKSQRGVQLGMSRIFARNSSTLFNLTTSSIKEWFCQDFASGNEAAGKRLLPLGTSKYCICQPTGDSKLCDSISCLKIQALEDATAETISKCQTIRFFCYVCRVSPLSTKIWADEK